MRSSDSIVHLAKALVAAQAELKNPPLDAVNPHFRNRYASLAGVRDASVAVLARHGLAVIQSAGSGERGPRVLTRLVHASGEWIEAEPLEVPASKQDAQGYGSAITYGRRYALQALLNVVGDDDDDAEAASRPARQPRSAAAQPAPAAAPPAPPGPDFARRLAEYDAQLAAAGACKAGELARHVAAAGKKAGHPEDLGRWDEAQIALARGWAAAFAESRRPAADEQKEEIDRLSQERGVSVEKLYKQMRWKADAVVTQAEARRALEWLGSLRETQGA